MVQNNTKWFFLDPLSKSENKLHLNEISRRLKKPHTIVRRYLNEFESEGILKKETIGRQVFYSLNKENSLLIDVLIIVEKEKLIRVLKKNLLLKDFVEKIREFIDFPLLIFGSATESKNFNDIDVLIIGELSNSQKNSMSSLENRLNKKIHIISLNSLNESTGEFKKEIISKHLLINNGELFLKWFH